MEKSVWEMDEEGENLPPTLEASLCLGLAGTLELICLVFTPQAEEKGRQVRLSMCVKQQIEREEGHMKAEEPAEFEKAFRDDKPVTPSVHNLMGFFHLSFYQLKQQAIVTCNQVENVKLKALLMI